VGTETVTDGRRSYYARTGSVWRDLAALAHPPYTVWHLSYVVIGAGLAADVDPVRLTGTVTAFAFGLGITAHAFDEVHSRPLATSLTDAALWTLGSAGLVGVGMVTVVGVMTVSPWVLAWAAAGVLLAVGYSLEWSLALHSDPGFALTWGSFPVVVGYWTQAESVSASALIAAAAAGFLALAQRRLSTPARFVRRHTEEAEAVFDGGRRWDRAEVVATWEGPMRALAWAMPALALALLLRPR
jgi:hypothetical protein